MSKRLPYFQFEPAEWLAGDIMFCSMESQGLYVNLMALYWQKDCDLTLEQARKRLNSEKGFEELISEKIIKIDSDKIIIAFLNEQWEKLSEKSNANSDNGRKGAIKRWQNNSQAIATPLKIDSDSNSESIALRREEKRKEEIIKEKIIKENIDARKLKFSSTLQPFLNVYGKDFLNDFYKYWTEPNKSKTKFRQELEKTWDLERRLTTWAKNDSNFKKPVNNSKSVLEPYKDSDIWPQR
jgi:uncharacterized protein YihD (DUF1040 family)